MCALGQEAWKCSKLDFDGNLSAKKLWDSIGSYAFDSQYGH